MAKDDYFVIVYNILAYLYTQLKNGNNVDPKALTANGYLCGGIPESYWSYIIVNLLNDGYITGPVITNTWGNSKIIEKLEDAQITPTGIDYVCNNSLLNKAKEFLKDAKAIVPFI